MKQVKVKNLKGNEIVALPIVTDSGTVLIHADVVLKPELIDRVNNLGMKSLYIKDYPEEVIEKDSYKHLIIGSDDFDDDFDDDLDINFDDEKDNLILENDSDKSVDENSKNILSKNASQETGSSNNVNDISEGENLEKKISKKSANPQKVSDKSKSDESLLNRGQSENLSEGMEKLTSQEHKEIEGNSASERSTQDYNDNYIYPHIYKVDETASDSRKVIKDVLEKHIYKHNQDLKVLGKEAERIMESVLSEPEVITNMTEIRNLSTDMYTHCINVCALSTIMALRLKMSDKQVKNISIGAILHDIGLRYIKVPYMNINETYMNVKDALEYKKHTIFGYSSLQDEDWIPDIAKEIILLHHERVDGKGYPFQHKGDKIKTEVKLVSLCDDFDSLISGVGSPKLKIYEAIEYIKANQGLKYDATMTEKLLESVAVYPVGIKVITSEGETGVVVRQNHKFTDRPVIKMLKHADGTEYEDNTEKDLMECLTVFIVDTE